MALIVINKKITLLGENIRHTAKGYSKVKFYVAHLLAFIFLFCRFQRSQKAFNTTDILLSAV